MLQGRPLIRLFLVVTLFIIVIPSVLWGIVQLYEFLCSACGCCEGVPRPRSP